MFLRNYQILIVVFLITIFNCCDNSNKKYLQSIQNWHQLRIDSLKGETDFLNLAGLYWLQEGENTFGSDSSNQLLFPANTASKLGTFLLKDSLVMLIPNDTIKIDGQVVEDTIEVYGNGAAKNVRFGSMFWFIIKREDAIGVRLRDYELPILSTFDSIDYFKTDVKWKLKAQWKSYKEPIEIPFHTINGTILNYPVKGAFYFTIDGEEYKLEPLGDPEPDGYFVMFYDKTSGHSTYGSGRYLYVPVPDKEGNTIIDFNKAFNPPCAFTEFATCLLPHKENRLPIFIEAGEKFSQHL